MSPTPLIGTAAPFLTIFKTRSTLGNRSPRPEPNNVCTHPRNTYVIFDGLHTLKSSFLPANKLHPPGDPTTRISSCDKPFLRSCDTPSDKDRHAYILLPIPPRFTVVAALGRRRVAPPIGFATSAEAKTPPPPFGEEGPRSYFPSFSAAPVLPWPPPSPRVSPPPPDVAPGPRAPRGVVPPSSCGLPLPRQRLVDEGAPVAEAVIAGVGKLAT